jgi:uncharacterized protein YebE (UPF0316 family)
MIADLSIPALAALIFFLRIVDVTFGTLRTIMIVEGKIKSSVVLGFFEIFIWITAISQVVFRINESLWLAFAYAAGFACGNAVGIVVERRVGIGLVVIRIVTANKGQKIADAVKSFSADITVLEGKSFKGHVDMIVVSCKRKKAGILMAKAFEIDPELTYTIERANTLEKRHRLIPNLTGWRSILKKK